MRKMTGTRISPAELNSETRYPVWGILAALGLVYLSPFLYSLTSYIAFVICIYRIVRYDIRVFATDYCLLIPVSMLFRTSWGMALLVYICLFAVAWYLIRGSIRADASSVLVILLMIYLVARMQLNITDFLLCFGQICLLWIVLPKQDEESAERTAKAFCISLIAASVYALVLRNAYQIRGILGNEVPAYFGSSTLRFYGPFTDPNYYMTLLVMGLVLLLKLKDCGKIRTLHFVLMGLVLVFFGILTYSKTFFLALVLLGGICLVWQFWNRKHLRGILLILLAIPTVLVLLFSDNSPFAVVLARFADGSGIADLTTGRTDIFVTYLEAITETPGTLLFGAGLAADKLGMDAHNLFLEITYYTGVVGLILVLGFFLALLGVVKDRMGYGQNQNPIAKYVALFLVFVLYNTLHGMFSIVFYAGGFLALLSVMLTKKKEA